MALLCADEGVIFRYHKTSVFMTVARALACRPVLLRLQIYATWNLLVTIMALLRENIVVR